jgi:hypothetical protein
MANQLRDEHSEAFGKTDVCEVVFVMLLGKGARMWIRAGHDKNCVGRLMCVLRCMLSWCETTNIDLRLR